MDSGKFVELGQVDKREFDLSATKIVTIPIQTEELTIEPSIEDKVYVPSEDKYIDRVVARAVTSDIDSNITPLNIRRGVSVLGVEGNLDPDKPDQSKTVNPSKSEQVVTADLGYELASVTVEAVTNAIDENITADNIKQGVSILGVVGNVIPSASVSTTNLQIMQTMDLQNIIYSGGDPFSDQYYADVLPIIYGMIDTIMGNEEV